MMAGKSPKDQFKKISICGGCTILGELPPEDPVCDSGIFCYGKTPVYFKWILANCILYNCTFWMSPETRRHTDNDFMILHF